MLRIGLTGGIGSGKSTVARIFETLGIPVYYADAEAKRMMDEDEILREELIRHFGAETYQADKLNRVYLAQHVFSDTERTALINSIIHPRTINHANEWMQLQKTPYVIKEAALIFEAGAEKHLDKIIGVSSPETVRIERAMQRDGLTEEQVRARMSKQLPEEEKLKRCDYIIYNDGRQLIPQVYELHQKLLAYND